MSNLRKIAASDHDPWRAAEAAHCAGLNWKPPLRSCTILVRTAGGSLDSNSSRVTCARRPGVGWGEGGAVTGAWEAWGSCLRSSGHRQRHAHAERPLQQKK